MLSENGGGEGRGGEGVGEMNPRHQDVPAAQYITLVVELGDHITYCRYYVGMYATGSTVYSTQERRMLSFVVYVGSWALTSCLYSTCQPHDQTRDSEKRADENDLRTES